MKSQRPDYWWRSDELPPKPINAKPERQTERARHGAVWFAKIRAHVAEQKSYLESQRKEA